MAKIGRPLKFKSPEELEKKIQAYFSECKNINEPPTICGLAVALDVDRKTLINYNKKEEYFHTIKKAKAICEYFVEKGALTNKLNPTFSIFNLKNNYGWEDEQKHTGDITVNIVKYAKGNNPST